MDYFELGKSDYPNTRFKPNPAIAGIQAEHDYSCGWIVARNAEQAMDQEWAFGRDTFAVSYWNENNS